MNEPVLLTLQVFLLPFSDGVNSVFPNASESWHHLKNLSWTAENAFHTMCLPSTTGERRYLLCEWSKPWVLWMCWNCWLNLKRVVYRSGDVLAMKPEFEGGHFCLYAGRFSHGWGGGLKGCRSHFLSTPLKEIDIWDNIAKLLPTHGSKKKPRIRNVNFKLSVLHLSRKTLKALNRNF